MRPPNIANNPTAPSVGENLLKIALEYKAFLCKMHHDFIHCGTLGQAIIISTCSTVSSQLALLPPL